MPWSRAFWHKPPAPASGSAARLTVPVFMVGKSGVGKTMLVNVLFAESRIVLPVGGSGTALPVRVRYAAAPILRAAYRKPGSGRLEIAGDGPRFTKAVREHAAGPLTSVTEALEVGWPCGLLQDGVDLIDLPGVGVWGDARSNRCAPLLVGQSGIACVVVDRAGLDNSTIAALRAAGALNGRAVPLVLVATKLDEVAREESYALDQPAAECLARAFAGCRELLASQLRALAGPEVVSRAAFHAISALDYRVLNGARGLAMPAALDEESTGVPGLRRMLAAMARNFQEKENNG